MMVMLDQKIMEQKEAGKKLTDQFHMSFRFVVDIEDRRQAAFMECTLPSIEWEMEEVKEGGLNTYVHQLPGMRKSATLSLKNGLAKSELLTWYLRALSSGEFVERKNISVTLLNSAHEPVMTWFIQNAYPTKWSGPQLKSDDSTIALQTLEMACGEISVIEQAGK